MIRVGWLEDALFIEMSAEQSENDAFSDFSAISLPFRMQKALDVNFESTRKFACELARRLLVLFSLG